MDMDDDVLLFWKAGPQVRLSPAEICRDLTWGEEVEGLIDLPVKEIIERLKAAFPDHDELPGQVIGRTAEGSLDASWGWQFIKIACRDLEASDRTRLIHAVGYPAYDASGRIAK
jgi:hypothetical protein